MSPRPRWWPGAALGLLAISGILLVLVSTRHGVGVSPDSVGYIGAARNLLAGRGLVSPAVVIEQQAPLALQPPLFPLLLSILGLSGLEPAVGARWLNAVLMGANAAMIGVLIYKNTQGASLAALLGMTLFVTSTDILGIHTMAWTEPLFIFFSLVTLSLVASLIERANGTTIAAGATASLAFLTRYPGAALVITGMLALISPWRRPHLGARLRRSMVFAVTAGLPLAVWAIRTFRLVGSPVGRETVLRPISTGHVLSILATYTNWFVPSRLPGLPPAVTKILGSAALAGAFLCAVLLVRRGMASRPDGPGTGPGALPRLLLIFAAVYVALLLGSAAALADFWFASLGGRHQTPVFAAALIALVCLGHRAMRAGSPVFRTMVVVVGIALGASYVARAAVWIPRVSSDGQGYASRSWRDSSIIGRVKLLPPDLPIYSNAPDAVYFLTGRPTWPLPAKFVLARGRANTGYAIEIARLAEVFGDRDAALIYFQDITWRWYLPTEEELAKALPVHMVLTADNATLYVPQR